MRVLILEDEAPAFRRLSNLLTENHPDIEIIDVLDTVEHAIKWLNNHNCPDLIFSDIQLSDGLSFEIYKQVKIDCPIIFTTAFDEYMFEAFKTNGIDYLLKPIQQSELDRSIEKFKKLGAADRGTGELNINALIEAVTKPEKKYKDRFLIKLGTKLLPVDIKDIAYFIHQDGMTELRNREEKKYFVDYSLDDLEDLLDPRIFFRLNRQCLAHISSIQQVHQYFKGRLKVDLIPLPENEITVSREKATSFKNWLGDNSIQ